MSHENLEKPKKNQKISPQKNYFDKKNHKKSISETK